MMSERDIKVNKSLHVNKSRKGNKIEAADGNIHKSRRNVRKMLNNISKKLDQRKISFEIHIFKVLEKFDKKCSASLHLCFVKFLF